MVKNTTEFKTNLFTPSLNSSISPDLILGFEYFIIILQIKFLDKEALTR